MAVAHVATIKGSDNTAGTSTTTSSVTTTTGEVLFLGVVALDSTATFTMTAAWNTIAMAEDKTVVLVATAGAYLRVSLFSLPIASGAAATAVISFSTTLEFNTWFLMRASGLATSSITDSAGGSGTGTGTAVATGAFTSTASDDYWVSVCASESSANPATVTATSPWTIPTNGSETNGTANMVGGISYIANPSATSEDGQWTISSSQWRVVGMAYKALAAGGTTNRFLGVLGAGI